MHQLTDLPDDVERLPELATGNARIRLEGTANVLAAARAAGASRFLAQSVSWELRGEPGSAQERLEQSVRASGGVALRYGRSYDPARTTRTSPPTRREPDRRSGAANGRVAGAAPRVVEILEAQARAPGRKLHTVT